MGSFLSNPASDSLSTHKVGGPCLTSRKEERFHLEHYFVVLVLLYTAPEVMRIRAQTAGFQRINHDVWLQRQRVNSDIFGGLVVCVLVSEYAAVCS